MSVVAAFAVPHPPLAVAGVGRGQEHGIASTLEGYREVARRIAQIDPDVLVFSSPHATAYQDYVHISPGTGATGDFARFGDPDDELETGYDAELVRAICAEAALAGVPAGCEGERDPALDHGTMVPLSFIQQAGVRCPIVRMGISGLPALEHYRLGTCVERACERLDRRAVYVASGDLSHKLLDDGPTGTRPRARRSTGRSAPRSRTPTSGSCSSSTATFASARRSAGCARSRSWPARWTGAR